MRRNQPAMLLGVLSILRFFAQLLAQTPLKPSFQVVSVKPNSHSGFSPATLGMKGNRFSATGMPLRPLIMQVYSLRDFQIVGGPDWVNTDQWDFEAVADDSAVLSLADAEHPERRLRGASWCNH